VDTNILGLIGHTQQQQQQLAQQTSKHDEVLSKLESIFKPQQENPEGWFDDVLRTALEAEKAGQPMPLTVKIAEKLLSTQRGNAELMKELEALKNKERIKENPSFQADQYAYNEIDRHLGQELAKAFGGDIPKSVAVGITQDLAEKIREEQQTNPQRWAQIRSNPQMLQRIVANAVAQTVPPSARRLAHEHQVANAVYTPDEIKENILEAQELLRNPEIRNNPDAVRKVNESITRMREMFWESRFPGRNGARV
jgi:hypothetical protein